MFARLSSFAATASAISQIHIAYTPRPAELSVDFVSASSAAAQAWTSLDNKTWSAATPATTFHAPTIGYMSQATLSFAGVAPGAQAFYKVAAGADVSPVFTVVPEVARPEVFAVYGDFGLLNDVCMTDLTKSAAAGDFDSVLHVGDWAYNFEDAASATGNIFMDLMQGYAATHPVQPAEGNHEACGACPGIAALPDSTHNFTEYKARFHSVALNSNTGNNRYYSFNKGLTHFIVFTAEAYLYARDEAFLANQLAFMKADLEAVDRTVTPWVVGLVHKDWTMEAEAFKAFSPILQGGNVDVLFVGHVHYYNRYMPFDPMTNDVDTKAVSADGSTYTNAKYMTTIVTGASGDREKDDKYTKESPSFTGSENYGYGLFTALNASHATWSWKTVKADGAGPADYSDKLTWIKA